MTFKKDATMMFDPKKPVATRAGAQARIICTDSGINYSPIVALIRLENGSEMIRTYTIDGLWVKDHPMHEVDLVNIPEKGYINIWLERCAGITRVHCSNKVMHIVEEAEEFAALFSQFEYLHIALEVEICND